MAKSADKHDATVLNAKKPPVQEDITLSIIIVNYNVKEFLEQTLISVWKALAGIASEIIVVDNASTDGSGKAVRRKFKDILFIENKENLGFARASNQGLKIARGHFLALLNPDTIVQEDTFTKMLQHFAENPDTGLLGCKILNPDGSLQLACRRSFPTPWVAFTKLSGLSYLFPQSELFGRYNLTYLDPDMTHEVEGLSGSFMMMRRDTLNDVGYLDESFFLYGEDLDWCYRVTQSKWKVRFTPDTQIVHFKGESSKRAEFDNLKVFYHAMGLFAHKHFRHKYLFMPYWLLWMAIWLRAGGAFLLKLLKVSAGAIIDFVFLACGLVVGMVVRFGGFDYIGSFSVVFLVYIFIWLGSLKFFGCYRRYQYSLSKSWLGVLTGFLINTSLTFFFNQYAFSRAVILLGGAFAFFAIPGWRLLVRILPIGRGLVPVAGHIGRTMLARKTVIVGDIDACELLVKKLNRQVDAGYDVCGIVNTNGNHKKTGKRDVKLLGEFKDLKYIIEDHRIQEVIFATHQVPYDQILKIMSECEDQRVNFKLIPSDFEVIIGKSSIDHIEDVPLLEIDYKLHQTMHRKIKRTFDVCLSLVLLVVFAPFFFVKKIFCRKKLQKSVVFGLKNNKISVYQISTRKNSVLDKFPYLWSVLTGHLSFVGKELREVGEEGSSEWHNSLDLKPGLTGLEQVNAHKNLTEEDKKKYLLYYLKNYSPFLDLEILFKSLFKL